jgi:branched-chain amino acid transport system permease protein
MIADFDYQFFIEVLVGGLLSGVMYSLVAIGFVLIYKTSGVLNFAQGAMLLFAALTFVSLVERGIPFALALVVTFAIMVAMGVAIERTVLRPLTNKPPITLFMATLGLSYIIEGAAQLIWGTQVHGLDLGIEDVPLEIGGVLISQFDIFAAVVAAGMVLLLSLFFRYTRIGLSFRAVADDSSQRSRSASGCPDLGHRVGCGRPRRAGGRTALGRTPRRAVLAVAGGAEGAAGAGARRLRFHPRRHRRRAGDRRQREARRGLYRRLFRRRHRELVRLCRRAGLPADPPFRPVRPEARREDLSDDRDIKRFLVRAGAAEMGRARAAARLRLWRRAADRLELSVRSHPAAVPGAQPRRRRA